ncbi:MAG: IS110 family transposase [Pseudomonadota bacterium]
MDTPGVVGRLFSNTPSGYQALLVWMEKHTGESTGELHCVVEVTGIYHEGLAYALHEAGAWVSVVNPAQMRDYAKSLGTRTKTDKKDALVIARFGATQQPRQWQPEPPEIRQLKALIARLEAVKQDTQRELNRLEKAQVTQASAEVLTSIETVHQQLDTERVLLETLINEHIDQHPGLKQDRALLESIPGVGPVISQHMVALLRSRSFDAASQCAAFLGLVPVQHESGSSLRGRSRLSKAGNAQLHAKLYMAAIVAKRHNPDIKIQYERLLRHGKPRMSALCAATRKLVHICFGVLKHQTPYLPQVT